MAFGSCAHGNAPSNVREAQQITQTCINEFNNTRIGKAANFMSMASPFIGPDRLGSTIEDVGGSTAKYGVYKYFQIASQTMPRTPFGSMSGFLSETIEMAAKDIVFPVAVAATGTQILMQGGCFASALNATGQANISTYVAP